MIPAFTNKVDKQCKAFIFFNVEPDIRPAIFGMQTSAEVWLHLLATYQDASAATLAQMRADYHNARQETLETIQGFITRVTCLGGDLSELSQHPISLADIALQILEGMHPRYHVAKAMCIQFARMEPLTPVSITPTLLRAEGDALKAQAARVKEQARVAQPVYQGGRFPTWGGRAPWGRGGGPTGGGLGRGRGQGMQPPMARVQVPAGHRPILPYKGVAGAGCHSCNVPGHRWFNCPSPVQFELAQAAEVWEDALEEDIEGAFMAQAVIDMACSPLATLCHLSRVGFNGGKSPGWVIDSGCSRDMTWDRSDFTGPLRLTPHPIMIKFGNGTVGWCKEEGEVRLQTQVMMGNKCKEFILGSVLLVPSLSAKLLSVRQHSSSHIHFHHTCCTISSSPDGPLLATGTETRNGLYLLDLQEPGTGAAASSFSVGAPLASNPISPPLASIARPALHVPAARRLPTTPTISPLPASRTAAHIAQPQTGPDQADLWHRRLGHLGMDNLHLLANNGLVTGIPPLPAKPRGHSCMVCDRSKMPRLSFPTAPARRTQPLDLLHMDLCSTGILTHTGARYIATITDDASRLSFVALLRFKDDAGPMLQDIIAQVETQLGRKVKSIRSDGGGEYLNHAMSEFCASKGILHQKTTAYSPQQNGIAERLNRTLLDRARAMLLESQLPLKYWGEAILTANYLRNRAPVKHHSLTPFEAFYGTKPDISHVRVFGCPVTAQIPLAHRTSKVAPLGVPGILLGYCTDRKAYRVLVDGKIWQTRDVRFHENSQARQGVNQDAHTPDNMRDLIRVDISPSPVPSPAGQLPPLELMAQGGKLNVPVDLPTTLDATPLSPVTNRHMDATTAPPSLALLEPTPIEPPRRASRRLANLQPEQPLHVPRQLDNQLRQPVGVDQPAGGGADISSAPPDQPLPATSEANSYTRGDPIPAGWGGTNLPALAAVMVDGVRIPTTMKEAMASPQADHWRAAIKDEYESLVGMGTWTVCTPPVHARLIGTKWVFDLKTNKEGKIVRYKARLVAQGFSQIQGIDYTELFAPVSKYGTMRALAALVAHHDLHLHQLDVKTAFLHGEVEEELYIKQPEGFTQGLPGLACKLNKSIYGLKQASRNWWKKLHSVLTQLGAVPCPADPSLYILRRGGSVLYILTYVDDMWMASGDLALIMEVKGSLMQAFAMTDLGESTRFLGIDITRNRPAGTIKLTQTATIIALAEQYGQHTTKPHYTPLPHGTVLEKLQDRSGVGEFPLAALVGSMNYIAQTTRPDVAQAVGTLGRHSATPGAEHWKAALRVLAYLCTTRHTGITFHKKANPTAPFTVTGFCDSDYGGEPTTRRSTTGYLFQAAGGPISWCSKLQPTVAASTTEAEYMAAASAAKEGLWLRKLLATLGEPHPCLSIGCDNQAALLLIKNPITSLRAKHIEIHHHFVRERVDEGQLAYYYVPTLSNAADVLTKPLSLPLHRQCLQGMGMEAPAP
jgi:transposase InsO family protein